MLCSLCIAYRTLGDFRKAIHYHKLHLELAKEMSDREGENAVCENLAADYGNLGDFKNTVYYFERILNNAKEEGNKAVEGHVYDNLGVPYHRFGDFEMAIHHHELAVEIQKRRMTETSWDLRMVILATTITCSEFSNRQFAIMNLLWNLPTKWATGLN